MKTIFLILIIPLAYLLIGSATSLWLCSRRGMVSENMELKNKQDWIMAHALIPLFWPLFLLLELILWMRDQVIDRLK